MIKNKKLSEVYLVYIIFLIVMVFGASQSPSFLGTRNIGNLMEQGITLGIIALAQMLILIVGGIDLSIGALCSCTVCILSVQYVDGPLSMVIGILLALALAILVGLVNGLGIVKLGLPPFIMTLATMNVLAGVALKIRPTPGGSIPYEFTKIFNNRIGILPNSTILWILTIFLLWWFLNKRRLGRNIYAVGGNSVAAGLSGIPSGKVVMKTYVLSSVITALGSLCLAARVGTGDPSVGNSYSMDSITVCALAGVSLFGGRGNIVAMFGATFILIFLSNILNLIGVSTYYQYILKGGILLTAVLIMNLKDRKKS